jgi:hypothetical protein
MSKIIRDHPGVYRFRCPGCDSFHIYYTNEPGAVHGYRGKLWQFNGDFEHPTFLDSLLNIWGKQADPNFDDTGLEKYGTPKGGWSGRCHLFVRNGKIEYCGDCTHDLAGRTVDMIEI